MKKKIQIVTVIKVDIFVVRPQRKTTRNDDRTYVVRWRYSSKAISFSTGPSVFRAKSADV